MYFLAFIGIIAILFVMKKGFNMLGNGFEMLGQILADRAVSGIKTKRNFPIKSRNIRERINTIKGNGTDKEYMDSVHKEIDGLTEE